MLSIDVTEVTLWGLLVVGAIGVVITWLADRAVGKVLTPVMERDSCAPGVDVTPDVTPDFVPPITVLKPVKGLDEGFVDNLLSLMRQDWPDLEILVGAADWNDPAMVAARRLASAHPHVRLTTVLCPEDGGLNPKVSILRTLSARARTDLVLISDSNVRVRPGYVRKAALCLRDPRVGLVTNPVAGSGEESTGAFFEGLHLSTYVARALAFAAVYLRRACVVGKSMLFRLSELERIGGWTPVRNVLAEDYAIGHAFERAGWRVVSCPEVIFNHNQSWSIARFCNRHLRWGQMRRRTCLSAYLLEPLFNPIPFLVVSVAVAFLARRPIVFVAALFLSGVRLLADRRLLARMREKPLPWATVLLVVPKDFVVLGLWVVGGFRRSLDWRGHRLLINAGTVLTRADRSATEAPRAPRARPQTAFLAPPS